MVLKRSGAGAEKVRCTGRRRATHENRAERERRSPVFRAKLLLPLLSVCAGSGVKSSDGGGGGSDYDE